MQHTTPALVAAAAARGLPRPLLLLGCALYIVFGFVAREPWRDTELAVMGLALELSQRGFASLGSLDPAAWMPWFRPTLLGALPEAHGPLLVQIGALLFKLLPFLAPDLLWRMLGMALLATSLYCVWQAIYHLARHPLAQPLPFAIGGEAPPLAYARALADTGLLALIASFGLIQPVHETTPLHLQFTLWCLGFYALALRHAHPLRATTGLALAAFGMIFAGWPLLGLLQIGGALWWSCISAGVPRLWRLRLLGILVLWLIVYAALLSAWSQPRSLGLYSLPLFANFTWAHLSPSHYIAGLQNLLWFTWPLWPMAALALWRWRGLLPRSSHLVLPLCGTLAGVLLSIFFSGDGYGSLDGLLFTLPGLATLAAFGVTTLKRGAAAALDWFALLLFTGMALAVWLFWSAIQWGWPASLAHNVAKLVPGFRAQWQTPGLVLALVFSAAWAALVVWRTSRLRKPLWKTYALSAGGTLLVLGLLSTLFFPVINYARSYQPWVTQLDKIVGLRPDEHACYQVQGLSIAQITALKHYRHVPVEAKSPQSTCSVLLVPRLQGLELQTTLEHRMAGWQWRGYLRLATRRGRDKDDIWVYTRQR